MRYDAAPASNRCAFALGAGEGALPSGHDYTGYVSLLRGTNILGVLDRHEVRVMGQAADGGGELSPEGGAWGSLLQRMAEAEADIAGIAGDLAHQAEELADLEGTVTNLDLAVEALDGRVDAVEDGKLPAVRDIDSEENDWVVDVPTHFRRGFSIDEEWGASGRWPSVQGGIASNAAGISNLDVSVRALDGRIDSLYGECAGGWRWPDYFVVREVRAGTSEGAAGWEVTGTNEECNVRVAWGTRVQYKGWEIDAEVVRQSDWEDRIEWNDGNPPPGAALPLVFTNNLVLFGEEMNWELLDSLDDEAMHGACDRWITGRLGGFEAAAFLEWSPRQRSSSAWHRFEGPATGSLLEAGWNTVLAAASNAAPESSARLCVRTWPAGYWSNNVVVEPGWNTNCWAWGLADYSCVSYWTDSAGDRRGYKPLTLVTPRHAIVANHYKPSIGSNVWWVGRSGAIHSNQVAAYRHIYGDLTVARLKTPLDTNDVGTAMLLAPGWANYVRGSTNNIGWLFGFPCVGLDAGERAHLVSWRPTAYRTGKGGDDNHFLHDWPRESNIPYYRGEAVGGDSGSPVFWPIDGTNAVLLGCYHTPQTGPLPTKAEVDAAIAAWGDAERCREYDLGAGGWTEYNDPDHPLPPGAP